MEKPGDDGLEGSVATTPSPATLASQPLHLFTEDKEINIAKFKVSPDLPVQSRLTGTFSGLTHGFLRTFPGLSQDFLKAFSRHPEFGTDCLSLFYRLSGKE